MPNFGAKILNTSVQSLFAQQAKIATTANNVANANSPGYARRTVVLENRVLAGNSSDIRVGDGVRVAGITRIVDEFLNKQARVATAEKFSAQIEDQYLDRVEQLFSLSGDRQTIGSSLTAFYSAIDDLTVDPSSLELRSNLLTVAQELTNTIKSSYDTVASLQTEIDERLVLEVDNINQLSAQIADLNGKIASREGSGNIAADERDRRDALVDQLFEKIGASSYEDSRGMLTMTFPDGTPLVVGASSYDLEVTKSPSFASGSLPPSLSGGVLNFVVFNYGTSATPQHVDLTSVLSNQDGTVGGLLNIRGVASTTDTSAFDATGRLVEVASRIESITRSLLQDFNLTYRGPDENAGAAGLQASSGNLNGSTPSVYGFFDFAYSGLKDADADGRPDDLASIAGLDNYSSILQLAISDPREIAASRDLNSTAGATAFAPGDSSNLTAISALRNTVQTFAAGSYSQSATYDEIYNQLVGFIGNEKAKAASNLEVAESNFIIANGRRTEVSGTSLEEEFIGLISAQKGYQASARFIQVAQQLLDELIRIL